MLESFTVTFSEPVVFVGTAAQAMTLPRTGTGGPIGQVTLAISPNAGPATSFTITFNDATFAPGALKSLIDGFYTLTLVGNQIKSASAGLFLDGDSNGTGGDSQLVNTFRLFGDSDGNGT